MGFLSGVERGKGPVSVFQKRYGETIKHVTDFHGHLCLDLIIDEGAGILYILTMWSIYLARTILPAGKK